MLGLVIMGLVFLAVIGLVIGAMFVEYKKSRQTTHSRPSEDNLQGNNLQQPGKGLYLSYQERKSWERRLAHNNNGHANLNDASVDPLMAEMIGDPRSNGNKPQRLSYEEWLQLDDCLRDGQTLTECFSQLPLKDNASSEELMEYVRYLEQRFSLKDHGKVSGTDTPPITMDPLPDVDSEPLPAAVSEV